MKFYSCCSDKRNPPLILLKYYLTRFVLPFKQEWCWQIKFIFSLFLDFISPEFLQTKEQYQ